ncbi:MAG: DUF1080 domain-containing protein, partial [Opitutaceae bacterium]
MTRPAFSHALAFALVCLPCAIRGIAAAATTPRSPAPGFVSLFNGKNLDGWKLKIRSGDAELAKKVFRVEDGAIHVFGKDFPGEYELNTGGNQTHGMIYTTKSYSKFIFRFDYKWGKKKANNFSDFQYDAGCYYHVTDDKIWPVGIEFQIRYNHVANQNHTGDFWSPPTTKIQWYSADGMTFALPSAGGRPQPFKKGEHLALATTPYHGLDGEWNTCELIA